MILNTKRKISKRGCMLAISPQLYEYANRPFDNNYVIIDRKPNHQVVIQHVKNIFWIFWVADERPFPTWESCVVQKQKGK
jgi:hypothetical protein